MKIAALYDIHGNLPALNAVLEELKEIQPDLIVIGGDSISGPMPGQTLQRLSQLGDQVRFIRGNADREVVMTFDGQPLSRRHLPDLSEKGHEEIHWVAGQLTRSERDFLAALPEQVVFQIENLGRVLFCHATSRNDEELFTPITPKERISIIFSGVEQEIVVCGHTHIQFEQQVGNLRILNAGSVGIPFADRPGAYWLLLSPQGYEFRRTVYDEEAAAQEIRVSEHPQAQEFAEENVLKVRTAAGMTEMFERIAKECWSQGR
ncbi:DeoR family transcriptional regulator [Ktedonobacter sp. SOSP1-52]|uniref:metallophosphoesterase family protein n=1 Tax=Ktedonobacter sp. SOSP1-52 TaxID=2778366 RepID=UPI0019160237|nr:metallophosphoesterase family protein [Ktedonobacter sp. SOSP1-52]GHO64211.1 DeoR family transcriptional regulator [Ktedonobacter sp. SOSP1-52]